jgi:hypothetical protein
MDCNLLVHHYNILKKTECEAMQVKGLQLCTLTYLPPLSHSHHLPSPLSHHPNLSPSLTHPPPFPTPLLYPTITTFPPSLSQNHYLPPLFPFLSLCPALLCFFVLFPVVLCCAFYVWLCSAVLCCASLCVRSFTLRWRECICVCVCVFRLALLWKFRSVFFVEKFPMVAIDIFTVTLDAAVAAQPPTMVL